MTVLRIPADKWDNLPDAKHHLADGVYIGEPNTDREPGWVLIEDGALTPGDQIVFDELAKDDGAKLPDLPTVEAKDTIDEVHADTKLADWRLDVLAAYPTIVAKLEAVDDAVDAVAEVKPR